MSNVSKTTQLQIRVSPAEKAAIQQAANAVNMDMSSYVLDKLLPQQLLEFQNLINELEVSEKPRFVLAQINALLTKFDRKDLNELTSLSVPHNLSQYLQNYLAAMVEYRCNQHQIENPGWTRAVLPLKVPVFGSSINNLRLYLLTHSPVPFRRRNIFVDTTIGGQV